MPAKLLVLLGCLLLSAPVQAQRKGASSGKAPAAKAKASPTAAKPTPAAAKAEEAPLPPEAQRRIALVEPAPVKGVTKTTMKKLLGAVEEDLKAQGFEIVPPAKVTALHLKRKLKVPACKDAPDCLAKIGKVAGAGYVANVALTAAGKAFGLKLTVVDTTDATMVSNIMGLVQKATDATFVETIRKQVPRAAAALGKRIAEKQALAVAGPVPEDPRVATPEPAPGPAVALARPAEPVPDAADPTKPAHPPTQVVATPVEVGPGPGDPVATTALPEPVAQVQASSGGPGAVPWVLVGAGAVAVGVGVGVFGTQAKSAAADFQKGLDPIQSRDKARSRALIADITAGAGAALVVVGAGLLLFWPNEAPPPVQAAISLTPSSAGVAVSGSF
ncbi:MAG: hypothetical protein HY901_30595 [Deltaproteobacteria bacterium]|nr:hypothetical protein [Deltaproteobacteria bacterium]